MSSAHSGKYIRDFQASKKTIALLTVTLLFFAAVSFYRQSVFSPGNKNYCLTGAFIADRPAKEDILSFERDYGKKAFYVMIFLDWESYPEDKVMEAIYQAGSVPVITWEPWYFSDGSGVSFADIIAGEFDGYIDRFALDLKESGKKVYLRFAHEMNGDWYPWSSHVIGPERYKSAYRHVRDRFDKSNAGNVKWVFSINWENVPSDNDHKQAYPGEGYVDYIGLDGYNWGTSQPWSRWMDFKEIFMPVYKDVVREYGKEVIITEFSSSSRGGDKRLWVREAFSEMKKMEKLKGFILFNVDKETDWSFDRETPYGEELENQLKDPYFKGAKDCKL